MTNAYSSELGIHVIDSACTIVTSESTVMIDLVTWYPATQTADNLKLTDDQGNTFLETKGARLTPMIVPYVPPLKMKGLIIATIDSGKCIIRRSKK